MRLVVARVGRAHGIRGEVTVEVRTDAPDQRFAPGVVLAVVAPARSQGLGLPAELTLASVRDHNGTLLLGFEGVHERTAADALRGVLLEADLPAESDEPDAWYDHELVGLRVEDPAGAPLGEVAAVEHPPAQDLLVVRRADGHTRLVPFVTALVPVVDVPGGRVVVADPGGLITDPVPPGSG